MLMGLSRSDEKKEVNDGEKGKEKDYLLVSRPDDSSKKGS